MFFINVPGTFSGCVVVVVVVVGGCGAAHAVLSPSISRNIMWTSRFWNLMARKQIYVLKTHGGSGSVRESRINTACLRQAVKKIIGSYNMRVWISVVDKDERKKSIININMISVNDTFRVAQRTRDHVIRVCIILLYFY